MVTRYLTKGELALFVFLGFMGGPVWVGAYFLLGAPADLQWMLWCGIADPVLLGIIACALVYYRYKSAAKTELLEQQGVLALAEVVGLTETNTTINDRPLVKLDLSISGQGFAPFNAQQRVQVSLTRQPIITGGKLVVLVDPTDNSYQIDWGRSAVISGVVPSTIRSAEDNRTYDLTGQVGPLMEFLQVLKSNRLPYNGPIDVRTNPDVRKQLLAIARRAAAAQQTPAAPQSPPPTYPPSEPAASAAQRMQGLETLRATGAITEAEYATKRQQIISSL